MSSENIADPQNVMIFDTTLRDGLQSPGISLRLEQKLEIAHQLGAMGVDVIEAGFPIASPGNFETVQRVAQEVQGPIIAGLARANTGDIEAAYNATKHSERPRIHTFISTSDIHIRDQMQAGREDVKGMTKAAVTEARGKVDDVEFSPMDATRSDIEFTAEVCQIAIDEGAATINIPDTVGYTQPEEYKLFLNKLYELIPALGGVTLSVHCHDDLGLAVANSFAGVLAGARQVECAVNGIGERAGNASLEEIVMLMRTRKDIDGFDTTVDSTKLGGLSRTVARHTGYAIPRNKAVVGGNAFQHESGIHQSGVLRNRETFEIMSKSDVGMDHIKSISLGPQSGRAALKGILTEHGVFKAPLLNRTYGLFSELADEIGSVSSEQLVVLQEEAERRSENDYTDALFTVSYDNDAKQYVSAVEVTPRTGSDKQAAAQELKQQKKVDGPVSAMIQAIKKATNTSYSLEQYSFESVGPDENTIGIATVELRLNGRTVFGKGVSKDTLRASGWAYLDALSHAKHAETVTRVDQP
jgi:2-isopropylmalate synthase